MEQLKAETRKSWLREGTGRRAESCIQGKRKHPTELKGEGEGKVGEPERPESTQEICGKQASKQAPLTPEPSSQPRTKDGALDYYSAKVWGTQEDQGKRGQNQTTLG